MSAKASSPPVTPPDTGSATLRTLIKSARGAFGKPLRIERSQGKLRLVLEDEAGKADSKSPAYANAVSPESQALLMRLDLQALLDRCANSRAALPHLAVLEHELQKRASRVFDELPLPLLKRAAGQLEGLAQEPVPEGFALLQARLDIAIVGREESAAPLRKPGALSSFFVDHKMQVSEVSISAFMRAAGDPDELPAFAPPPAQTAK